MRRTSTSVLLLVLAVMATAGCAQRASVASSRARMAQPVVGRCRSDQLTVTLARVSGAGGHEYFALLLTTAGKPCALSGYPGVSFLDRQRRQLGAAAYRVRGFFGDHTTPSSVFLAAGTSAHALLMVDDPDIPSPSACHRAAPAFLRVYPPGESQALTIPDKQVSAICLLFPPAVAPVTSGDPTA